MTRFSCRLGTPEGRVLEQVHEAHDEESLREDLENRGYHLFEVRRRGLVSRLRLPALERGKGKIPLATLLIFNQELAALLRSGLPMLQALGLTAERQRDPLFRSVLSQVRDRVKSGEDLSAAVESFGELFPPLYSPTLRAGERSGDMEEVIRRFIRYQKLLMQTRKRVVSALVYPATLIGLSVSLIAVMTVYVVPQFTDFFSALRVDLPLITRITMGTSSFVTSHLYFLLAALALAVLAAIQFRLSDRGEAVIARVKLRIPILGPILHRMALSEFCRSLATLLAGGIPLVASLEVAVRAVGNRYVRGHLKLTLRAVREGKALATSLEETGVVSDIVVDMVKVGEDTGALDDMLADVSDFLDEEVETRLERLLTLLEPVMMILMGLIVATLLVSIYLPIFSLLGQANV